MIKTKKLYAFAAVLMLSANVSAINPPVKYVTMGRTEILPDNTVALIGAASSVSFGVRGDQCTLKAKSADTYTHHNYVVIEVDGQYYSRNKVSAAGTEMLVMLEPGKNHTVTLYKATEASVGTVVFTGIEGKTAPIVAKPKKKIAFIGDSITCGMGNDLSEIPCGSGQWYDQHNAYYSYAPITARTLGADFVLSSVSGMGMYRNWNDDHKDEAVMPEVYENLYLNKDTSKKYDFAFVPDITCIALGTNDFSDGDGKKPRTPFSEDKYVNNYIEFIKTVYKHAPKTKIVLLNSPMVTGTKGELFVKCLNRIKDEVNKQPGHSPVEVFTFSDVTPHGCGYHPEIEDDKAMAAQLAPFLKTLLK